MSLAPATAQRFGWLPADDRRISLKDVSALAHAGLQEWYSHGPAPRSDRVELEYRRFFYFSVKFAVDNSAHSLCLGRLRRGLLWLPDADIGHPDAIAVQIPDDRIAGLLDHGGDLVGCLALGAQCLGNPALLFRPFHF